MYVFVLGTGRCGSTLVHDVLARHPHMGFVSNLDDRLGGLDLAGRVNSVAYRKMPVRFTEKGRIRFAPSEGYRILDRQVSPVLTMPFRDLTADDATPWVAGRFKEFFERRRVAQAKPVFLHKFTGWPRTGFIQEVFPDARFVHIVRDGRAVANSWLQMPWWRGYHGPEQWHWGSLPERYATLWQESGRSHVVLAGLAWCILMDAFDASAGTVAPANWLELRYEDVVTDSRGAFKAMLEFMDLDWNDEFDTGFSRYEFRTARHDAFRRDLAPHDVEALTSTLAAHLDSRGYL